VKKKNKKTMSSTKAETASSSAAIPSDSHVIEMVEMPQSSSGKQTRKYKRSLDEIDEHHTEMQTEDERRPLRKHVRQHPPRPELKWKKRHFTLAGIAVIVGLLVIAVSLFFASLGFQEPDPKYLTLFVTSGVGHAHMTLARKLFTSQLSLLSFF
jgi:hypothetical protein